MLEYLAREQHASKSETIRHLITRRYQERSSYGQAQPQEQAGSRQAELDDTPDFLKPVQHDTMAQEKDKWRPRDFSKAGQAKGGKR